MIYNSFILRAVLSIFHFLKKSYYSSMLATFVRVFSGQFKNAADGSSIWNFIKRPDFFTRVWEHSRIFRIVNRAANAPSKALNSLYIRFEKFFENSMAMRIFKPIIGRFEILLGLCLAIIMVIPHNKWNNFYSVLMIFVLFLIYFIKTVIYGYEGFNLKAMDFVLLLFIISIAAATVTSIFPRESFKFALFYATSFLLVFIIISAVKTGKALDDLIEIVLVGITITGLYGVWQNIVGMPADAALTDVTLNEGMPGRIFSTMGNPNNYAEILLLTLPFYAAIISNSKSIIKKIIFGLMAVPPLASLVMTGARSAWVSFLIVVFVFVFLKNRKLIPLVLILGLFAIPFIPDWVYRRIMTIWNPNDTSAQYRVWIYEAVWPMIKEFWFTGIGLGPVPFMKIFQRYYKFMNDFDPYLLNTMLSSTIPPHSHNLFVEVWIEAGLAGFFTFVWFWVRLIKKSVINIFSKADVRIRNVLIAGVSSLVGISLMSVAEYIWFYPRVMLVFWMDIGIIMAGLSILASRREVFNKPVD